MTVFDPIKLPKPTKDLRGQTFGRLTVTGHVGVVNRRRRWTCVCECGETIIAAGFDLMYGDSKSCGCLISDVLNSRNFVHGGADTVEYSTWFTMKRRCYEKHNPKYPSYGGRGIIVCDRWRDSFANFLADVGPRPSSKHSLDRFPDNNGNYEPGNVRWATSKEQSRNRRSNRLLTYQGVTKSATEWGEEVGIPGELILGRIKRGWSVDRAISTSVIPRAINGTTT